MSESQPQGPPYAPTIASVGGHASPIPDVPICAVLLVFYVGAAVGNMTILQLNQRKTPRHKFLISGMLFGFCMARILTLSLRMGSAYHPSNISLAIASMIFVNAGILIIYIVNLIFIQRIIRARQPQIGWSQPFRWIFRILYILVAVALVLVIVFIVLQFYTLSESLRQTCRDAQLAAITYLLVVAFLPLPLLALTYTLPVSQQKATNFGAGSIHYKSLAVLVSSLLCTLGAGFKAGANWAPPRPANNPAWYQEKPAFYVFFFVLEILIIYWFIAMRVDQRMHVPDGSSKRQSYHPYSPEHDQYDGRDKSVDFSSSRPQTGNTMMIGGSERDSSELEKEEV